MRAACDEAVRALLTAAPDTVVVVGDALSTGPVSGVLDLSTFGLRPDTQRATATRLPLSVGIGVWLLRRAGWVGAVELMGVCARDSAAQCAALGVSLVSAPHRVALLAMGDASSCRPPVAPRAPDERAVAFDASVAVALRDGDPQALLAVELATALALGAVGRAAWQVLAGAAGKVRGGLLHDAAPYGVGYLVASWIPEP